MDSHPTFDLVQPMGRVEEMREDVSLYREQDKQNAVHDLSSWRVTIPRTGARPDPENFRKQYYVFIIDVRRVDVQEGAHVIIACVNEASF